jgi:deferrochelatase/peroxidase EfeB
VAARALHQELVAAPAQGDVARPSRRRRTFAFPAPQARQEFPKTHIATLLHQQAHRKERRAPAAVQFERAFGPVRQTVRQAEGWRMHGGRLDRYRRKNSTAEIRAAQR